MKWRARDHEFTWPGPTQVMGILNVTPDSFFDGGRYADPEAALERALEMVEEGAALIDIGGESTRPGAATVSEEEEIRRVLPVLVRLRDRVRIPLSVDTRKPAVARAALDAGADIINDVGAATQDPELWARIGESGAGYVAMHMQGDPGTMQRAPAYGDVVQEVADFFRDRLKRMQAAGLEPEQVILDVGIGFGKGLEHNLQLLANLGLHTVGQRPLLLGVSRKSFMGKLLEIEVEHRLPAALACAAWAAVSGVGVIRAHDVFETLQVLRMTEALLARKHE